MSIFRAIFAVFAIIGGAYIALGIWLPGVRGNWGGLFSGTPKEARERVSVGTVSCAGFGLLLVSVGLMLLLGDAIAKSFGFALVVCSFGAFFLIIAGWLLDSRAHDSSRGAYRLPGETRTGTPAERQRWVAAACVIILLVGMNLLMIFHG